MNYIIIDTSSMLFGLRYNKNIFELIKTKYLSNYKIIISKGILNELTYLSKYNSELALNAKAAIQIINSLTQTQSKVFIYEKSSINVDSWILRASRKFDNSIIITNDTKLAEELKKIKDKESKETENKTTKIYKLSKQGILRQFY